MYIYIHSPSIKVERITIRSHENHGASNYLQLDCLFRHQASNKTLKLHINGLFWKKSNGGFPSQRDSKAESMSMLHDGMIISEQGLGNPCLCAHCKNESFYTKIMTSKLTLIYQIRKNTCRRFHNDQLFHAQLVAYHWLIIFIFVISDKV